MAAMRSKFSVLARRTMPTTRYPLVSSSSARYEPSWPVIPVIRAVLAPAGDAGVGIRGPSYHPTCWGARVGAGRWAGVTLVAGRAHRYWCSGGATTPRVDTPRRRRPAVGVRLRAASERPADRAGYAAGRSARVLRQPARPHAVSRLAGRAWLPLSSCLRAGQLDQAVGGVDPHVALRLATRRHPARVGARRHRGDAARGPARARLPDGRVLGQHADLERRGVRPGLR